MSRSALLGVYALLLHLTEVLLRLTSHSRPRQDCSSHTGVKEHVKESEFDYESIALSYKYSVGRLFSLLTSDRTLGNGIRPCQGRFRLDIRKKFFMKQQTRIYPLLNAYVLCTWLVSLIFFP